MEQTSYLRDNPTAIQFLTANLFLCAIVVAGFAIASLA